MADYDVIDRPSHYLEGRTIEPLEVIEDWELDFHIGQVVKYCARAGRKGSELQDLKKARFYLDRKIEHAEEGLDGLTITGAKIDCSPITASHPSGARRFV